jgi:hypothetical protein
MKRQAPHETQQPQLQPPQPAQAVQALQPPMLQPLHPLQPPQPPQPLAQRPTTPPPQPLHPLQPRWANCWPGTLSSLSKTKNVPKLTSNISSSLRVNCGGISCNCTSGVGPTAPVPDAPPVIAMDMPTTPATGTAFFRCFCLVCGIAETSTLLGIGTKAFRPQHNSAYALHGHLARSSLRTPSWHPYCRRTGRLRSSPGKGPHQRASAQLVPRCRETAYIDAVTESLQTAYN